MKRILLLLPCALFPYGLVFAIYRFWVEKGASLGEAFAFFPYLIWAAVICTLLFIILSLVRKWEPTELTRCTMIVKLMQIPAYILIFLLGCLGAMTLFTWGLTVFCFLFDCCAVFLSGAASCAAIRRSCAESRITKRFARLHSLLQFVFCLDVVSAVMVYRRTRAGTGTV